MQTLHNFVHDWSRPLICSIDFYCNVTKKLLQNIKNIDPIMAKFESVLACNSSDAP